MGERHPRQYLAVGLLYAACIFSIIINPMSFIVPVVHRIAAVTPDEEFAQEYAFHAQYNFWCCSPLLTRQLVTENQEQLGHTLEKYGFTKKFTFADEGRNTQDEPLCTSPMGCVIFTTAAGRRTASLFGDRLRSIQAAKDYREAKGNYYGQYMQGISRQVLMSLFLGGLLLLLIYPRYAWHRRLSPYIERFSLPDLRLPQPAFLRRFDYYLLTNKPWLWSIRIHTFLFNTLVYGSLISIIIVISIEKFFLEVSNILNSLSKEATLYDFFLVLFTGIIPSSIWASYQSKIMMKTKNLFENQATILLYIAIANFIPMIISVIFIK